MNRNVIVQLMFIAGALALSACGQSSGNAPSITQTDGGGGTGGGGGGGTVTPTDCTNTSCNMFITHRSFSDANIGGPSGADAYCASDANKPNDGSTYKALVVATGIRTLSLDWVLYPNHTYKRLDSDGGYTIGTTTGGSIFPTSLTNDITNDHTLAWITGINISLANGSWNVGSYTCSGLTSTSGSSYFGFGQSSGAGDGQDNFGVTAPSGNGQASACDGSGIGTTISSIHLLCVQQ